VTAVSQWTPAAADIAALIPSRTLNSSGDTVGTFDGTTIPTASQVASVITIKTGEITTQVGDIPTSPVDLTGAAKACATLGAAALVELGFFDDDNGKRYSELNTEYQAALMSLARAVGQVRNDGSIDPAGEVLKPTYAFPAYDPSPVPILPPHVTTLTTRF
jgi:hypothetical protein